MKTNRRIGFLSLVVVAAVFLVACDNRQDISRINADPARFRDKNVTIAGTVTDSYGFLGTGAYQVDDGTGRMWVVTTRGTPSRGSRVGAKGRVHSGFSFGGRSFGTVMEESDRRIRR